ncbi:MAG TPA: diguanylate cyclase, partial [Pseudonocardiaceae bacterium]|nr:diguanylate cyclase [Pseudonocardiaceae bacterium]
MSDASHKLDVASAAHDSRRERLVLARKWAYLLVSVVFVPLSQKELEQEFLGLVDALCDAVHSEPFNPRPARAAGARLVELGCFSDDVLPCTVDVLGKGLVSRKEFQPIERFAERIALGLGALAGGFAQANRRATFDQQEHMQQSLIKAVRDAQLSLRESEARFDKVATSSASGIMITARDGRLIWANSAITHILGYTLAELEEMTLFDIVLTDSAPELRESYQELLVGGTDRIRRPEQLLRKDGDIARISLTASLVRGDKDRPGHVVTVVDDATELTLLQGELTRRALHDMLTGLPNRPSLRTGLENALRRADPAHGVSLFHLGLDGFSVICDGLGRQVGERLLVEVGWRLKAVVAGEVAMVARLDGARFGILVTNSATTPSITTMVANINDALSRPTYVDGHGLVVTASVGVVHRPSADLDPTEILQAADLALHRTKAAGRGQWALFHPDQDIRIRQNYRLAADMPGRWDNGEISVVCRPVAELTDGRTIGVAAQLRWDHPDLGPLPHDRCVELAEQTGLIMPLGDWLLRIASQQFGWWRRRLAQDLLLTV